MHEGLPLYTVLTCLLRRASRTFLMERLELLGISPSGTFPKQKYRSLKQSLSNNIKVTHIRL